MVISGVGSLHQRFPSRVISLAAEKFSSGIRPSTSKIEVKRERGRRMVAEELKLSRVDVKERQQKFETMANGKDSKPSQWNRSQSAEMSVRRSISPPRNIRSVSAEPGQRSTVFKQVEKLGVTANGTGRLKQPIDLRNYRNSVNVGKVADKFERKSEKAHDITPPKRSLSPSDQRKPTGKLKERFSESIHEKNNLNSSEKQLRRSALSPSLDEKVRKWGERDNAKKLDYNKAAVDLKNQYIKHSDRNNGISPQFRNNEQSHNTQHGPFIRSQSNDDEKILDMKQVVKDTKESFMKRNFEEIATRNKQGALQNKNNDNKEYIIKREDASVDGKPENKQDEPRSDDEKKDEMLHDLNPDDGNIKSTCSHLQSTTDNEVSRLEENNEVEPMAQHNAATKDGHSAEDTRTAPNAQQADSKPLERTPSMRILVLNKEPKSPAARRAIVRVNSRASDKGDLRPKVVQKNKVNSSEPSREINITNMNTQMNLSGTVLAGKRGNDDDVAPDQRSVDRGKRRSSEYEEGSCYYRDVRHGLRGQRGLSPEKQQLLSELLSLENQEMAKTLGLSDDLIELLREEEGFWKRQVELKKWRETQESKGKDAPGYKFIDPAKERKIAELRRQHSLEQLQKANDEKGLTVEELRLAEQRMLSKEASELLHLVEKEEDIKSARNPSYVESSPDDRNPTNKKIFLKQYSVGSGVPVSNDNNSLKRDKRYSYPPPADIKDQTMDKHGPFERKPYIRSFDHLSRSIHSTPIEQRQAPPLNTVSNGPITYFEHIANMQRKSLVAEPYASHPRRKSIENMHASVVDGERNKTVPPSSDNVTSRRFDSHDSVFERTKDAQDIGSDGYQNDGLKDVNQNNITDITYPFRSITDAESSFQFARNDTANHSPSDNENVFKSLQRQHDFTDPSYLSLINNHKLSNYQNGRSQRQLNSPNSQLEQTAHIPVRTRSYSSDKGHAHSQVETILNGEHDEEPTLPVSEESTQFDERVDGTMRTYHVTSVAVRYARAGPSSEVKLEDMKSEVTHPLSGQGPYSEEEQMDGVKRSLHGSRAFSENDSLIQDDRIRHRYFSDEVMQTDKLWEAKLIVAKTSARKRCSTCQRLINDTALMTVAGSEMAWHTTCFYCVVCGIMLVKTKRTGITQVRLIDDELHCITCFSQDGGQLSEV